MRGLIFLSLIPSFIAAKVLCPNGKTVCPEELYCCEIDGEYSCCDHYATTLFPDTKMKVYPGVEIKEVKSLALAASNKSMSADVALKYDTCTEDCLGTCCNSDSCCPHRSATCCDSLTCCPTLSQCCSNGCCENMSHCCGSGCCERGTRCCGSWCCDEKYICGNRYMTCRNKGMVFSPELTSVLVLAFSSLVFRHF
ncbi:progranulin-like [Argiope bruennichi]|uniref:progranulin-like n=1 Tax=Argiope bruennichi TaxID=94029 RepID=UPI0024957D28|nr:progranulin-like [Argiope bruennichi]